MDRLTQLEIDKAIKNKYLEKFLKDLETAKTEKQKFVILNKIYEEGFEDGANSQ